MKSFKQQCILLRKKDHTLNEIMEITGRSKTSVYFHIKDLSLSAKKQEKIRENIRQRALNNSSARKGKALKAFKKFKEWDPEHVLLVGHLIFDGEISRSTCAYNNRSTTLINRVEKLMLLLYNYEPKRRLEKLTGVHRISYYNVELAEFIYTKATELRETIKSRPLNQQKEFIRAFFDDEGCMDFRKNKRQVRGYQNDREILLLIHALLTNFGITSRLQGKNEVVIIGKENLIKFQKEINFSEGVRINPNRTNSLWKKNLEKRKLLDMAIKSFKK